MATFRAVRAGARLLPLCAAVAATLGGCALNADGSAPDPVTASKGTPSYALHTSTDCTTEEPLVRQALRTTDVRADVNGDGRTDKVAVVTDDGAAKACRVFVAVKLRGADAYSTALDPSAVPPQGARATIEALPDLGNDPGAEIVVDTRAAVDGVLAQLFTLTDHGLTRVPMPAFEDGNFYVEGAGVTYPRGASCNAKGAMILSMATLEDDRYQVTRHVYPVRGDELRLTGPRMTVARVAGDQLVDRFPEFGTSHFAACTN
jgi:hypothetical protein